MLLMLIRVVWSDAFAVFKAQKVAFASVPDWMLRRFYDH